MVFQILLWTFRQRKLRECCTDCLVSIIQIQHGLVFLFAYLFLCVESSLLFLFFLDWMYCSLFCLTLVNGLELVSNLLLFCDSILLSLCLWVEVYFLLDLTCASKDKSSQNLLVIAKFSMVVLSLLQSMRMSFSIALPNELVSDFVDFFFFFCILSFQSMWKGCQEEVSILGDPCDHKLKCI